MLERELREKEELDKKQKEALRIQKEQLDKWKLKKVQEIEEDLMEGEILRKKGLEDLEHERAAYRKRREMAQQALVETRKANDYLRELKKAEIINEKIEADKIRKYAEHKEEMERLRKQRETEIFQAKQTRRQRIIDAECARMLQV